MRNWILVPTPAADRLRQVDKLAADGAAGQRRVFDYNAAGWLTAVQLPEYADQKMRYAYDDLGNVTAKELVSAMYGSPLGYAETLAYDALSRLTARTVTLLGTTTWHTFTYDGGAVAAPPAGHPGNFAWGRLTHDRTTYGDAPGAALAGVDRGGTTSVTGNTATTNGAVLFGLDYDNYEANGNIAAVTRTLRTGASGARRRARLDISRWQGRA